MFKYMLFKPNTYFHWKAHFYGNLFPCRSKWHCIVYSLSMVMRLLTTYEKANNFCSWLDSAVAPAVLAIEWIAFGKQQSKEVVASIVLVCVGVGLSTMSDLQLGISGVGFLVGCGSIAVTSLYLIWAGRSSRALYPGAL